MALFPPRSASRTDAAVERGPILEAGAGSGKAERPHLQTAQAARTFAGGWEMDYLCIGNALLARSEQPAIAGEGDAGATKPAPDPVGD